MSKRAFTLLETLMALFLLTGSCIAVLVTLNQVIHAREWSQANAEAALLARARLEALRHWARDPAHFRASWASQLGTFQDPDHPGFSIRVERGALRSLPSPCSNSEGQQSQPRLFTRSSYPVAVEVWHASTRAARVRLVSQCAAPNLLPAAQTLTIVVAPVSGAGPLAPLEERDYRVTAQLPDGTPLELMFVGQVLPDTGNATVLRDSGARDGRTIRVKNAVFLPRTGGWQVWPGRATLLVTTRYFGRPFEARLRVDLS